VPRVQEDSPLGGLTPAAFLRKHWQKSRLLIRQAMPGFSLTLSLREVSALALRDDVESRLVIRERGRWSLTHGPLRRADLRGLPARNWTLLVQGVNLHVPAGDALLRRFAFIPYARLDDLMVSYAAPGGGVGPHFDSYDVFLLQGQGQRRWRIGRQRDLTLKPGLPLKILARFEPDESHVLRAGDMLYLPPNIAHEGTAVDACITYSIGFHAPSAQELATAFLDWLRDTIAVDGRYADPDLSPTTEPARIARLMQSRATRLLRDVRWDRQTVVRFLGCFLTEPKPTEFFSVPVRRLVQHAFAGAARRRGVRLDAATRLLYDECNLYINGVAMAWPDYGVPALKRLANARGLRLVHSEDTAILPILYQWYANGFLHIE